MAKRSNNSSGNRSGLPAFAFWLLVAIVILLLVTWLLEYLHLPISAINALRAILYACALVVTAIVAWRYVRGRNAAWIVLYVLVLLIGLVFIVLPIALF